MRPIHIGRGRDWSNDAAKEHLLHLTARDLATHVHGVGASRSGKSKMIEWIARELIRWRHGFCLIDPHGSLYEDLLAWLSYLGTRREDIVLFNPSDRSRVVGFNPFARGDGDISSRVDRLIRATVMAWGVTGTDQTPRLERYLRCYYGVLLEKGLPINVADYLFNYPAKDVRRHLTGDLQWQLIRTEWETIERYNESKFDDRLESTKARLFRFLASKQIGRIMGPVQHTLDLAQIMEEGKILLCNLQPSEIVSDEQARLIGTLLLNEIWDVVMRRRGSSHSKPRPYYLVIDEFQNYLTPDIPTMLDQAAKRGLHLMLFHQHLGQLKARSEEAYGAVMTNARVKLVFGGLNRCDARTMVEEMFPGQIDLKQVKHLIEQTKFWPTYDRDTVTSSSGGHGSGGSRTTGPAWDPATEQWIPSTAITENDQATHQESWTDVPIYRPEAFVEEIPMYYSLEEILWGMTDRLMEQYQRHFFIRRPGEKTLAAVTPYVESYYVKETVRDSYVQSLLTEYASVQDVDRSLRQFRWSLESEAQAATEPRIVDSAAAKPRRNSTPRPTPPEQGFDEAVDGGRRQNFTDLTVDYMRLRLPYVAKLKHARGQARRHYSAGEWTESFLNSRMVIERVFSDVARVHSDESGNHLRPQPKMKAVRDYLLKHELLDRDSWQMAVVVYGRQSHEIHPDGEATAERALLSLRASEALGQFVLQRFESWRNSSNESRGPSGASEAPRVAASVSSQTRRSLARKRKNERRT